MVGYAPYAVVDGPPRLPLPHGLFSVVSFAENALERWENGVTWPALTCEPASVIVADCEMPTGLPKNFEVGGGVGTADAFLVMGSYKCGPVGDPDPFTFGQRRAREHLAAREQTAAELKLWSMLDDDPVVLTGGDPLLTLATLEKWMGDNYGSLGVMHMSRWAATILAVRGLIEAKGNQMLTKLGTPVIVGTGYPGTGAGISEQQRIATSGTVTGGTFTLTYAGQTTTALQWNATAAQVRDALNALSNLSGITTSGGPLPGTPVLVNFDSDGDYDPAQMTVTSSLTGTTPGIAVTTTIAGNTTAPAAGSEYVAVSPAIFGYRGEVFEQTSRQGDTMDVRRNDVYGIAERPYLLGYDPCGVAMAQMTFAA